MEDFNLDFFVDGLKETFNKKKNQLSFSLHVLEWKTDISLLDGDDPDIRETVDCIVQSAEMRREFEQKQELMLFEEADTILESVNEMNCLAAINWYAGLRLVTSDWRDGVKLLLKSNELIDMSRGIVEHVLWQQIEAIKKEQATHGGKAKAALYAPLKAEVIRLLLDKQPNGGWKSKKAALDAIDEELFAFIEQYGFPGFSGEKNTKEDQADVFARIPRLVSDWSRDDPDIKAAFESAVKQKKKNALKAR